MARKVTTIPATLTRFTSTPIAQQTKRNVAAYARVSTDHEEQLTSYEAQVDYYTNYIKSREDWEFVKVYTDEGITGTSTKYREGFKQMVADALDGKIDLIVTKSVSRFARNTVDSLTTIRQLKEKGVECYFEKENIWTFDSKGELLLTIMSSLAQEESRSISENCTWGQRKRFADGKVTVPFGRFLGYDRGANGELIVNEEQAKIVRRIYSEFLQGKSYHLIAKGLTADVIPTPGGKEKWSVSTVKSILSNEKYKGDALLQKSYTTDYLTKKKKLNEGEIPQYYVEGDHEAIISAEIFDMVQREMGRRRNEKNSHSSVHLFSGRIKCGECGGYYGSKVWHSNSKYRRVVWQCNQKYKGGSGCGTPHLTDDMIQSAFISALNKLLENKKEVIKNCKEMIADIFDTSQLETERDLLVQEMQQYSDLVQQCINENAHTALDQSDYQKRYDELTEHFNTAKAKNDTVTEQIYQMQSQRSAIEVFLRELQKAPITVTEFSTELWNSLADFVTVHSAGDICITFKNGQEIRA